MQMYSTVQYNYKLYIWNIQVHQKKLTDYLVNISF